MNEHVVSALSWEDVKELVLAAESLYEVGFPSEEAYYTEVLSRVRGDKSALPPINGRFLVLLRMAEKATGYALGKTKSKENTLIRTFVAYRLDKEGYGRTETGRMMNRDHSSVLFLIRKMRDMMSVPRAYAKELSLYREFESLIEQHDKK